MLTITPTVGRKVYFYREHNQAEPMDATVVRVCSNGQPATPNTPCNLYVIDGDGHPFVQHSIAPGEEGDSLPHFRWMPYQVAQAAKG